MNANRLLQGFILAFLFLSHQSFCQDFIVTSKGDTLTGKVRLLINGFDKKAQVIGVDGAKKSLPILQVRTLTINGERYEPVKYLDVYVFMKLVKEGYLSLYAFQIEKQLTYDGSYLVKKDGTGMEVPNLGFKKHMSNFVSECESLSFSIAQGSLKRDDLAVIIDQFNTCIASNNPSSTAVVTPQQKIVDLAAWDDLQQKVESATLPAKQDALDMIAEIKAKLSRAEKLPKFLVDGLQATLSENETLTAALSKAMLTVK